MIIIFNIIFKENYYSNVDSDILSFHSTCKFDSDINTITYEWRLIPKLYLNRITYEYLCESEVYVTKDGRYIWIKHSCHAIDKIHNNIHEIPHIIDYITQLGNACLISYKLNDSVTLNINFDLNNPTTNGKVLTLKNIVKNTTCIVELSKIVNFKHNKYIDSQKYYHKETTTFIVGYVAGICGTLIGFLGAYLYAKYECNY